MFVTQDACSAGAVGWKGKDCYNSERALRREYEARNENQIWQQLPKAEKNRLIIANKSSSSGPGRKRQLRLVEEAENCALAFMPSQ